ncbi:unnamed protein product [Closterium sp. NIES-53]
MSNSFTVLSKEHRDVALRTVQLMHGELRPITWAAADSSVPQLDTGVQAILDKLVCIKATVFLHAPMACTGPSTAVLVAGGTAAAAAALYLVLKPLYERFLRRDVPFGPDTHPVAALLLKRRPVHASHRGGARAWPENTMLAYRSAVGVDAAGRDTVATSTDFAAPGASDAPLAPHSPHAPPPDAAADAAAAPHTPDAPSGGAATAAPVLRTQLLEVDVQLTRDQQLVRLCFYPFAAISGVPSAPTAPLLRTQPLEVDVQLTNDQHLVRRVFLCLCSICSCGCCFCGCCWGCGCSFSCCATAAHAATGSGCATDQGPTLGETLFLRRFISRF